ncbi:hypothetical protein [Microvirga guangxiensis]|uniref:DUF1795 domain-containing protein n=1 Tax=Microvirga guangxiensis TaxID=549386 RepID=A0A1G5AZH6_9HYPH|nr:hypothetical protein [Microvirga guangxiensis]SCX83288.1 hypothetical protein SAMN02927923_00075 [Microvirga guangxiensis]
MSRFLRLLSSWSFCLSLFLIPAYIPQAAAEVARSPIPAQVVQIDGYPFPAKLAGLVRGLKTDYGTPGLGFSVRYETPGEGWVDIFIYDLGYDLTSSNARQNSIEQRDSALDDIKTAVSAGSYQEAKLITKADANPYAKAHLMITQRGTTRDSFIFITVAKKHFVKIRYTTSARNAEKLAEKFASEYARLLK